MGQKCDICGINILDDMDQIHIEFKTTKTKGIRVVIDDLMVTVCDKCCNKLEKNFLANIPEKKR